MSTINYDKVFSNLCHIKALSHDNKFGEIVQHLILNTIAKSPKEQLSKTKDVVEEIKHIYGILLREHITQSNIDKLISLGKIKQIDGILHIDDNVAKKIAENVQKAV